MKFGTRSALTPAGWESMVALLDPLRLYDLSPGSFVSRELMAYAENAGNSMPLSRYLPLQKGEVIFPESITGNMPSDFSKYAKAIKRVFSAGQERAVCRILPVSGGVWLLGGVGDRPQNAIGGISGLGDRGLFLGAGALPYPPDRGDPDAYPAGLL